MKNYYRLALATDATYAPALFNLAIIRAGAREKELFAANKYQDYLFLHGLSVEMAEALAELWHKRLPELREMNPDRLTMPPNDRLATVAPWSAAQVMPLAMVLV